MIIYIRPQCLPFLETCPSRTSYAKAAILEIARIKMRELLGKERKAGLKTRKGEKRKGQLAHKKKRTKTHKPKAKKQVSKEGVFFDGSRVGIPGGGEKKHHNQKRGMPKALERGRGWFFQWRAPARNLRGL